MDRRTFMRVGAIGGSIGLIAPQLVLAEPVQLVGAGGLFYTKENPGHWSGKEAGHMPQVMKHVVDEHNTMLHVMTEHKMLSYKHYIVKHVLLDNKLQFLNEKVFNPDADEPMSEFTLTDYSGTVYVLSVCNLHDTWLTTVEI